MGGFFFWGGIKIIFWNEIYFLFLIFKYDIIFSGNYYFNKSIVICIILYNIEEICLKALKLLSLCRFRLFLYLENLIFPSSCRFPAFNT